MNYTIPKIDQIVDPRIAPTIAQPLSKEELCAFNTPEMELPVNLGTIQENLAKLYGRSFIYYLLSQGRELFESGHYISVKDEIDTIGTVYEFPNLISRSGNVFTINKEILEDEMGPGFNQTYLQGNSHSGNFSF
jgi:hypothetical protein